MKTNELILLILFLFCLCQCANDSMMKEDTLQVLSGACLPEVSDRYTYPVMSGTKEWQTSDDAYQLVQLPDKVLKTISTLGLIDALVNAPLFSGSFLFSSSTPVDTWHRHYGRFNCATELFKRKDAGDALVMYYKSVCFDCFKSSAIDENFRPALMLETISGLGYLFTKQEILDKIGHQKKQELVANFLLKLKQMPDIQNSLVIPMAWLMFDDEYAPIMEYYRNNIKLYEQSIACGYVFSQEQADLIISFAKKFY